MKPKKTRPRDPELTTDEAIRKLFPQRVVKEAKERAEEASRKRQKAKKSEPS